MFSSVLIANRGEIACRVIRTARKMGLRTIAVYSTADRNALHVRMADEAVALGGTRADESYLSAEKILKAARERGADCIHPGYGFLAENAGFAEVCTVAGVTFVGPPVRAIRAMGRKDEAKTLMIAAGVPVLPGHDGEMSDSASLRTAADAIGYPVMIKAVAGGGGTGMRRVDSADALDDAMEAARREAGAAFGDARVILEKCLERPRHIEVQVFADSHGNCVHMFERDCSLQRRHQKVIEEAPAPGMPQGLRERMCAAAVSAASAVGYTGAGTVEFLTADVTLDDRSPFYFLEMNTRLQVEHPVTEQVTGLDLVELQFRVAAGEPLGLTQDDITLSNHAVEARIYAEDPDREFLPSSGTLHEVRWPDGEGIRVETGVATGGEVSPFYDPMLAKVIATGADRTEAVTRLRASLENTRIAGPRTNVAFLHALLGNEDVQSGHVDTGLIGRDYSPRDTSSPAPEVVCAGVIGLLQASRNGVGSDGVAPTPWDAADGFTLAPPVKIPLNILVDATHDIRVQVGWDASGPAVMLDGVTYRANDDSLVDEVILAGERAYVFSDQRQCEVRFAGGEALLTASGSGDGVIRAPMHGRIAAIEVAAGDSVAAGDRLAVLEAMKMEHVLAAPTDGIVSAIDAAAGDQVDEGAQIMVVDPAQEDASPE